MTDSRCYVCNGSKIDPNYGAFSTIRCPVCSTVQQNEKIPEHKKEHKKCWNCYGSGSIATPDASWGSTLSSRCTVCDGEGFV
jgi:DnaJ-class molecular chaperone